jgi:hypothetical protein
VRRTRAERVIYDFSNPEEEPRRLAHVARLEQELRPLFDDLRDVGVKVADLEELGMMVNYPEPADAPASRVFARWLTRVEDAGVKEALVMGLTTPWSQDAVPEATQTLLAEFRDVALPEHYRWSVAQALGARNDDALQDEYPRLVRDPAYGRAREPLIELVARRKDPGYVQILAELLCDEPVDDVAARILPAHADKDARARAQEIIRRRRREDLEAPE